VVLLVLSTSTALHWCHISKTRVSAIGSHSRAEITLLPKIRKTKREDYNRPESQYLRGLSKGSTFNVTKSTPVASKLKDSLVNDHGSSWEQVNESIGIQCPLNLSPLVFQPSNRNLTQAFRCYYNSVYKFAFVHVAKNGGSSIGNNLQNIVCRAQGLHEGNNCSIQVIRGQCPVNESFFYFTFSRNPWDRAVSMWTYGLKLRQLKRNSVISRKRMSVRYCTFKTFLRRALAKSGMGECGAHSDSHQWLEMLNSQKSPGIDFVGRIECFERDFRTILSRIDPSGKLLSAYLELGFTMHNDSGHRKYSEYYKDKGYEYAVSMIWRDDVDRLGYNFSTFASMKNVSRYADGQNAAKMGWGFT